MGEGRCIYSVSAIVGDHPDTDNLMSRINYNIIKHITRYIQQFSRISQYNDKLIAIIL